MRSEEKICEIEFCDYFENGYCKKRTKKSIFEPCPDMTINGRKPIDSSHIILDEVHRKYDPTHKEDE